MLEFTCDTKSLVYATSTASRAVSSKNTIPALEGLLITAGSLLILTGYNTETGITCKVDHADIQEMGRAVFPAKIFGEIVAKLPGEDVHILVNDDYQVQITSGESKFRIMSLPADEFPELPDVDSQKYIEIEQEVLKNMLSNTIFCVSDNKARPILNGCKFEITPEEMYVVACDGFRFAMWKEKIENLEKRELEFVVPSSALNELIRILGNSEEMVSFAVGTKHIIYKIGNTTLICRLLEGKFMDWQAAVPKDNKYKVCVNVKMFLECIERVNLVVDAKLKSPVKIRFGNNECRFMTNTTGGNASDYCSMAGDGEDLEIGFNGSYFIDALKVIPDQEVMIEFKLSNTPVIIKSVEKENFMYMILPIRLG